MKVLFVYRVYGKNRENPVIQNQINSLKNDNIEIIEFHVLKGGISSYLKSILLLKKIIKKNKIDLIHAHYSYSGFLASISTRRIPVICSLMGSDVLSVKGLKKSLINFFINYLWKKTIVKSSNMKLPNTYIIPNGIDFNNFKPIDREHSRNKVGFNSDVFNIIFVATDLRSKVKNYYLAKETINSLGYKYKLHGLSNIPFEELPYYYNAADLLLLTSYTEGSPNVIKEALACNCPIVSTDVGDVKELTKNISSCIVVEGKKEKLSKAIKKLVENIDLIDSRSKIRHLSQEKISRKLMDIYKKAVE